VEVPLTAAWQEAPVLGCHPVDCRYIEDKLRARACADATNLMLEDFGSEPERFRLGLGLRRPALCPSGEEMVGQMRKTGPGPYRTQ
jgi:coenzyme F420-reducing hydrogenase delta subunit